MALAFFTYVIQTSLSDPVWALHKSYLQIGRIYDFTSALHGELYVFALNVA